MTDEKTIKTAIKGALEGLLKKHYPHGNQHTKLHDDMILCEKILQPSSAAARIEAHGIVSGSAFTDVDLLVNLLSNGIDRKRDFSVAPLSGSPQFWETGTADGGPYKDGLFVVISDPDETLLGAPQHKHGIKAVLVNPAVHELVPELKKQFPKMTFITYDKINDYLNAIGLIERDERDELNLSARETMKSVRGEVKSVEDLLSIKPLRDYNWSVSSYGTGKPSISLVSTAEEIGAVVEQLEAEGLERNQDFNCQKQSVVVMSGYSENAKRVVDMVMAEKSQVRRP